MKALVTILVVCFSAGYVSAEYSTGFMFGMEIDSSSNMLMRPEGLPGSISSMYGGAVVSTGTTRMKYGVDVGMLSRYKKVQFHYHNLELSHNLITKKNILLSTAVDYGISRYGDVTVLSGYNKYGIRTKVKAYLAPALLLRSEAQFRRRTYRTYTIENNDQTEFFLRLDKFFNTGTTVRGQIDAGTRHYGEQPTKPHIETVAFRARVAQSIGQRCGMWVETYNRLLYNSVDDSTKVSSEFDRVFLDDKFKYSSYGLIYHMTYLVSKKGVIHFETSIAKKQYEDLVSSPYEYLPPGGWKEWEWDILFAIAYKSSLYPKFIHPRLEVFYKSVDATFSDLSFNTFGTVMRFELY